MTKFIRITNLQGQLVFEQTFNGNIQQFTLSSIENGVYLYEVLTNNESLDKGKIIIQH